MSALSSKHSSKPNITISLNNNQPQSTNRNKIKNQKTASKYSSSALSNKQQQMQITFQKTGQKLKKNLSKQFQTFNINQNHKQKNQQQPHAPNTYLKNNHQNMTKSKTNAQMTTQAKSPIAKSNHTSKNKLPQYQQNKKVQETKIKNNNERLKKSRENSNRPKSPMSSNRSRSKSGSRNSSPQVSPSYSKKSISSFKRALSKKNLQKSQKNQIKQNPSFLKQKNTTERKIKQQKNDLQINFPQLITESQSVYPSSSYPNTGPNTGKLSQNYQRLNSSKEESNMYIEQQQESEGYVQNRVTQEDYISEGQEEENHFGMSQTYLSKQTQHQQFYQQSPLKNTKGYQQLPLSYITAMQILQKKIQQHENTIKKLHKTINSKDQKYLQLGNHVKEIQAELNFKQEVIAQKDNQIKFLKGYLNEEKINNREALKQIAKNVYERSISAKKDQKNDSKNNTEDVQQQKGQEKRKLFQGSPIKEKQIKRKSQQPLTTGTKQTRPDFIQKLIGPQIYQMEQLNKIKEKQRLLQQQLQRQELIKDQMMREQILREEALRKQIKSNKKYNYMEEQNYVEGYSAFGGVGYQQIGGQNLIVSKDLIHNYNGQDNLRRQSSVSTVIKRLQERQPESLTYRPRNVSVRNQPLRNYENEKSYSVKKQSPLLNQATPIKRYQLRDPILDKYIHQKSELPQNPYSMGRTINTEIKNRKPSINDPNYYKAFEQLKSEKKNRDTVSQMRQLMRAQKQLIVLNYKLQALEKKILLSVQSAPKDQNRSKKYQNQQQNGNFLLEQLQRQYSIMKKEYEKKQIMVNELKMKLQYQK